MLQLWSGTALVADLSPSGGQLCFVCFVPGRHQLLPQQRSTIPLFPEAQWPIQGSSFSCRVYTAFACLYRRCLSTNLLCVYAPCFSLALSDGIIHWPRLPWQLHKLYYRFFCISEGQCCVVLSSSVSQHLGPCCISDSFSVTGVGGCSLSMSATSTLSCTMVCCVNLHRAPPYALNEELR